jgi:hypothetical protein
MDESNPVGIGKDLEWQEFFQVAGETLNRAFCCHAANARSYFGSTDRTTFGYCAPAPTA